MKEPRMNTPDREEAWIRLPSEEEVRAASQGQIHPYERMMGGVVARMARLLMAHEPIGQAFRELARVVLFGPGALSRAERELVAAVAASAQDCAY